ncbi:MAG TPA: FAD-binding oxidoreductase [Nocardioidaceae bacterium]|nr:FAD-binding oxidoreductase [Nocardioidaceae bacterium]
MSDVVGWEAHARAVARLQTSYDTIPPGQPVRLAKRTSNLFRARSSTRVPGLDVSGLGGVVAVDTGEGTGTATADVQGMCTYEDLVDVTLPLGFIPYVVPQLRSITLGGAVTGLGIESTSFRNGLPHESVIEMDVLTGDGRVVTTRPGEDLFDAFPNSYGSLGYATRLRIRLEEVPAYVDLRHVRFGDLDSLAKAVEAIVEDGEHEGVRVDGLDGVVFEPGEAYLTLATWRDGRAGREGRGPGLEGPGPGFEASPSGSAPQPAGAGTARPAGAGTPRPAVSDYTGMQPYYRSVQQRETDTLTMYDYLWRWDTDWFWCSGAFGLHDPRVRRLWPRRWRRSDVYSRIIGLESRYHVAARLDRLRGRPERERVIQDIEVRAERLPAFLRWFDEHIGMRPVWLCPLRATRAWPSYPLEPGATYVNVGFWGTVPIEPGAADGDKNRAVEAQVTELGGHKSLYSDAYYDREAFDRLYGVDNQRRVKALTDPDNRLTGLYEKAVNRR